MDSVSSLQTDFPLLMPHTERQFSHKRKYFYYYHRTIKYKNFNK